MRGIRAKLFVFNISVVIGSFIVISFLLYNFLGNYYVERESNSLVQNGARFAELTVFAFENPTPTVERLYKINMENYSKNTGGYVAVYDKEGKMVAATSSARRLMGGKILPQFMLKSILEGKTSKELDNFGGFLDSTALWSGTPVLVKGEVVGGVFIILPVPYLDDLRTDVIKMFLWAVLVTLAISGMVSFYVSKKISDPLKLIGKASRQIAEGDFEKRVDIKLRDEIGELAHSFNFMAESLQNLEQMRSSFVANVSHELRTPMTIIAGFIEGINDGTIPKERHGEYLCIVLDEVKRLSRLVSDLLDVARIESGGRELTIRPFDINEQIRLAIIRFEQKITNKNINVEITFDEDECFVNGDIDAIERVLTNLVDNAVKFTNDGGQISARVYKKEKKAFVFIENSGEGISKENLKFIWDRFYKTDKSRSMDKSGVGLGLYIVKSLISQHKQEIFAQSDINGNTRFTFTLDISEDR